MLIELHDLLASEFDTFAKIILEHDGAGFMISVVTSREAGSVSERVEQITTSYIEQIIEKFTSSLRVDFQHPMRGA